VWQALQNELGNDRFVVITVALDRSPDDARPWIAQAGATHPSLVDSEHRVADLYRIINVPTGIWIDEAGRIARPNDAVFGSDTFVAMHGIPSGPHLDALRAWVTNETPPFTSPDDVRARQVLPTLEEQQARAEFTLAWHLHREGRVEAAERHFVRAGELAPHDWTIRRGSMPIRGLDPMGEALIPLWNEWTAQGMPYYPPMKPPTTTP
jgi:hypothetical protein